MIERLRQLFDGLRGLLSPLILLQDLRCAVRRLRRDRVFACVAVLILALGIGRQYPCVRRGVAWL